MGPPHLGGGLVGTHAGEGPVGAEAASVVAAHPGSQPDLD